MINCRLPAFLLIILVLFFNHSFSQELDGRIQTIEENFKNFDYGEVIRESENLLRIKRALTSQQIIEIYTMKGIAHYTLAEDDYARECFLEILRIDSSFNLDESKISPKIITFYSTVKEEYLQSLPQPVEEVQPVEIIRVDTVFVPQLIRDYESEISLKNSIIYSVIFPGAGHIYNGDHTRGWILSSLAALSLASSIYFIIDSGKKEEDYLQERNRSLIEDKYNSYDFSYRMKNISVSAFVAVWLYTQFDLLFLSGNRAESGTISLESTGSNEIIFSYQIRF